MAGNWKPIQLIGIVLLFIVAISLAFSRRGYIKDLNRTDNELKSTAKQLSDIQISLKTTENVKTELQTSLETLQKEHTKLSGDLKLLQETKKSLESKLSDLVKDSESTRQKLADASGQNTTYQARITEMEQQLAAMQAQVQENEQARAALESRLAAATAPEGAAPDPVPAHLEFAEQALAAPVNLKAQGLTVQQAVLQLLVQSEISYNAVRSYLNAGPALDKRVTINLNQTPLRQALDKLLLPAGIEWEISNNQVVLKLAQTAQP